MNALKKITCIVSIILLCIICSGCGFTLRSKTTFPAQLKKIYFSSTRPYSALSIQLNKIFDAMNVQLVKKKNQASFSVVVSNDHFIYGRPEIVNAALPTNLNFSQTATVNIENNKNNVVVASQSFNTAQSLTLNSNQMYTTNSNTLMRQELSRQIASLIYYWLISNNTKAALTHANNTQTIKHTP